MAGVGLPFLRRGLICALAACMAAPLFAQSTPALPAWPEHQSNESVYDRQIRFNVVNPDEASKAENSPHRDETPVELVPPPLTIAERSTVQLVSVEMTQAAPPTREPQTFVAPASNSAPLEATPSARDHRHLAPPSDSRLLHASSGDRATGAQNVLPNVNLPVDSIYTTGTALAVVVGLFLGCAWLVRRGMKKTSTNLPEGVVSVLGRVPLGARQFAELVRVGNKLVLLSVSSAGVETLTEITDPAEIDRLVGMCQQTKTRSSSAEFDDVFRQLAGEPAQDGFLGNESFAELRGGRARA
jgi:flagellar protein FliO/FliZ